MTSRRSYGSGSLYQSSGNWYGRWYSDGRRVKRKIGPVRTPGSREGFTRAQAEREMRRRIEAELPAPTVVDRLTVGDAGARLLAHLESLGRKRSTLQSYESFLRVHLAPHFGERPLARIGRDDVEGFIATARRNGQSVKSTLNLVGLLHGIFEYAIRRGWATANPCKLVEKPKPREVDADVRFLDQAELDALLVAVPSGDVGRIERVLYLAAAMSGMRQASCSPCAGATSTGRRAASACAAISCAASSARRSPSARRAASRSRTSSAGSSTACSRRRRTSATPTSCSAIRTPAGRWTARGVLKRFKAAQRRSGVRELRFHDLRHTFGTRMAAAGVPMRTLQE